MTLSAPVGFAPPVTLLGHLFSGNPQRGRALCGRRLAFVTVWERVEPRLCGRCKRIAVAIFRDVV